MTAMNVFVEHDAVHISTDGAGYRRGGVFAKHVNKTALLPQLNAAIGFRGIEPVLKMLVERSQDAPSFDELVSTLRVRMAPIAIGWRFEAAIAGWSESRNAPEAYLVSSVRKLWTTTRVAKMEPGDSSVSPSDGELAERCARLGVRLDMVEPDRDAFIIMDQQRVPYADGRFFKSPAIGVGAFCQLTTVTRFETTTRVVGRWNDKIGEQIKPDAA